MFRLVASIMVASCSAVMLAACGGESPSNDLGIPAIPVYPTEVLATNGIASDFLSMTGVGGIQRNSIHRGIDIKGPSGQPIIAIADGRVVEIHVDECWGPTVAIDHGSSKLGGPLIALYGHVDRILVEVGQSVSRGDAIAQLGDNYQRFRCMAGVRHLHLELGRARRISKTPGNYWGSAYFLRDYAHSLNPHLLWSDGPYQVTCFGNNRDYEPGTITYPVPCGHVPAVLERKNGGH